MRNLNKSRLLPLCCLVLFGFGCPAKPPEPPEPAETAETAPAQEVSGPAPLVPLEELADGGIPKDGIPSIDAPKFVSAKEAGSFVKSDATGVLLTVGKTSRFYPYSILVWHEIVNDVVEDRPLAVSYSPLSGSAYAFDRWISGRLLDFGVSGKLWQSSLVMHDRATGSLWPQVLKKAAVGPLTGSQLILYPIAVTTFEKAVKAQPGLEVLSTETGHERAYGQNPYPGYGENDLIWFPLKNEDNRQHPKELMYLLEAGNGVKAYKISELTKNGSLDDTLGGVDIRIAMNDSGEIIVTDQKNGKRLLGFQAYWFLVAAVHPEIAVWP
jgi:hypothetical protein